MSAARPVPVLALRVLLVLVALVLAATVSGRGTVAEAAPTAGTTSATASSTQNVGPALGWAQDVVYVQDDASSRWPVAAATKALSKGSSLRLVLVSRCPAPGADGAPVQCIRVSSKDLGGGTLAGTTDWTFVKSTNKLSTATVQLNDRWARHASYADRLNIAEHELGHGVGLPHVKRTSSIMNAVAHGRTKPDAGDLRALKARY